MSYFTWKESSLTSDCSSLKSMAKRYSEAASLMAKMDEEGFELKKENKRQLIIHQNQEIFEDWGFISEEGKFRQLPLIPENK